MRAGMKRRGILGAALSGADHHLVGVISERKALGWPETLTWEMVSATEQETKGKEHWQRRERKEWEGRKREKREEKREAINWDTIDFKCLRHKQAKTPSRTLKHRSNTQWGRAGDKDFWINSTETGDEQESRMYSISKIQPLQSKEQLITSKCTLESNIKFWL